MLEIKQTKTFSDWRQTLTDQRVLGLIAARIDRLAFGHSGDAQPIGEGVSELRIHYGPGYRIYFQQRSGVIVVLLCGGDKSTQTKDIKTAKRLAAEWSEAT